VTGTALPRAVLRSLATVDRMTRVARGAADGLWLGVLDLDELHRLDAAYYAGERMYLDDGYNRRGLWAWEREALDGWFPTEGRVAVTGAGAGREVLALVERGYDAVGYECNADLAAAGNALLDGRARIEPAPRDRFPDGVGPVDGLIVGWGSYSHLFGRAARVEFLRGVAGALRPGAPVLVSFLARQGASGRFRVAGSVGSGLRRLRGRPPLDLGDALVPAYAHYFTEDELRAELLEAGLEPLHHATTGYGRAVARRPLEDRT
jgi:hypothetical protein